MPVKPMVGRMDFSMATIRILMFSVLLRIGVDASLVTWRAVELSELSRPTFVYRIHPAENSVG